MKIFGKISSGLVTASLVLLAGGASAATVAPTIPQISGVYNVMMSTVCQASVPVIGTQVGGTTPNTTTTVLTIDPNENTNTGKIAQVLLTATFTPSATNPQNGHVSAVGTYWGGDLVYTGTSQGTSPGINAETTRQNGTYAANAKELRLTFQGQSNIYQVLYSNVVNGAAQRADLVSVYSSTGTGADDCIEHGTAVLQ